MVSMDGIPLVEKTTPLLRVPRSITPSPPQSALPSNTDMNPTTVKTVTPPASLREHRRIPIRTNNFTDFRRLAVQHLCNIIRHNDVFQVNNHIYDRQTGQRLTLEKLLAGENQRVWNRALSNEWGWLAQGNKYGVVAQNAIELVT